MPGEKGDTGSAGQKGDKVSRKLSAVLVCAYPVTIAYTYVHIDTYKWCMIEFLQ